MKSCITFTTLILLITLFLFFTTTSPIALTIALVCALGLRFLVVVAENKPFTLPS